MILQFRFNNFLFLKSRFASESSFRIDGNSDSLSLDASQQNYCLQCLRGEGGRSPLYPNINRFRNCCKALKRRTAVKPQNSKFYFYLFFAHIPTCAQYLLLNYSQTYVCLWNCRLFFI